MSKFDTFMTHLVCSATGDCAYCGLELGSIHMQPSGGYLYLCKDCSLIKQASDQKELLKRKKQKAKELTAARKFLGV